MSSGPWKKNRFASFEGYGPSLMSRQVQEAVGSAVRMKLQVQKVLPVGERCWLQYHVALGTEKYKGISEVIQVTDFFVVFRDIRTGIRHAFDYMDIHKGFTAKGGGSEGTYLNSPIVVRKENKKSYAEDF